MDIDNNYDSHNRRPLALVLCGGGARGAYQAGFLHKLFTTPEYIECWDIEKINGTSIGAINGYYCATGNADRLRDTWNNHTLSNFMTQWCTVPFFGKYISYVGCYYNLSFYKPNYDLLFGNLKKKDDNILNKFSCTVTCYNNGNDIFINGDNAKLDEYMKATMAAFGLPPILIDNKTYFDGGLFQNIPINFDVKQYKNNKGVVLILDTVEKIKEFNDDEKDELVNPDSLLTYIKNIITIQNNRVLSYEFYQNQMCDQTEPIFSKESWMDKLNKDSDRKYIIRKFYKPENPDDQIVNTFEDDIEKIRRSFKAGEDECDKWMEEMNIELGLNLHTINPQSNVYLMVSKTEEPTVKHVDIDKLIA